MLDTCKRLEKEGFEITYLPVDKSGIVSVESVANAIKRARQIAHVPYVTD